ncbi:MAG: hypothetical protein JW955_22065 [Sedimentisphaerales bacterium]|nr:hypothetical protein [Sedimentisphaerales bacterium]
MRTAKTQCGLLALGLVSLLIIAALSDDSMAGYDLVISPYTDESEPHEVDITHKYESAYAGAYASESGYAFCSADAVTDVDYGEDGYASADSVGTVIYEWTYSGPPSTPPGGDLEWSLDGDGGSEVDGTNAQVGQNDDATNASTAVSVAYGATPSDESSSSGSATGSVSDYATASGYWSVSGYREDPYVNGYGLTKTNGHYLIYVDWDSYYESSAPEEVPEGTGSIVVWGSAGCGCESATSTSPNGTPANAFADCNVNASVAVDASFTSN